VREIDAANLVCHRQIVTANLSPGGPAMTVQTSPTLRTHRTWPLRACLALNLVGAGVPGALLLARPDLAPDIAGEAAAPEVARLVGAIWCSVGIVSLLGLARPHEMRGLLATQVVYKSLYVVGVGLPAIAAGTASPTVRGLTAGFAAIVVGWSAALVTTRRPRAGVASR
jgi:hypothetical protein